MKAIKNARDFVVFYLNGKRIEVRGEEAFLNLSDFLRVSRELTGTKVVCAEGDCGACTILRAFPKPGTSKTSSPIEFETINSCVARVAQMDGSSLVTVEAVGTPYEDNTHPVQKAMLACHGSQCGFCTPGFIGSLAAFFETKNKCDSQKIKNALTGNLCRCTGYQPIINAALSVDPKNIKKLKVCFANDSILNDLRKSQKKPIYLSFAEKTFIAPSTVEELRKVRKEFPESTLIAAGTDLGVAYNKGRFDPKTFLSLHLLAPLYQVKKTSSSLQVGARVSITELRKAFKTKSPEVAQFLDIFASPQIKNFATLVGNIANASPIADTPPLLFALNAKIEIFSPATKKNRIIPFDTFNLAYKKTALKKGELIWSIHFELPKAKETVSFSKTSQRRDLDISCINTGFWFKPPSHFRLGVGGVGPIPLRLRKTEALLLKEGLSPESIKKALKMAQTEITPMSDLRGSDDYRRLLTHQYLNKFLTETLEKKSK